MAVFRPADGVIHVCFLFHIDQDIVKRRSAAAPDVGRLVDQYTHVTALGQPLKMAGTSRVGSSIGIEVAADDEVGVRAG